MTKRIKMIYESEETKIESKHTLSDEYFRITIKKRLPDQPGKFVMISIPGYGESPFYISSSKDDQIELIIKKRGNLTTHLSKLKAKDKIFIRGPYGRGYPLNNLKNKNLYIISENNGIGSSKALFEHIIKKRAEYKNVYAHMIFKDNEKTILKDDIDNWSKKFIFQTYYKHQSGKKDYENILNQLKVDFIQPDSVIIISVSKELLKKIIGVFVTRGISPRKIYFNYEMNMQCGVGKCGTCMIHGKLVCSDGPVFRLYELEPGKDRSLHG